MVKNTSKNSHVQPVLQAMRCGSIPGAKLRAATWQTADLGDTAGDLIDLTLW